MKKYRHAWVEVDKTLILQNLEAVRRSVGKVKICAVLKADGYGLGAVELAKTIQDRVHMFAVAILDEALELKESIPDKEVLVLGHTPSEYYAHAVRADVTLTMHDVALTDKLAATAISVGKKAKIHMKIETGMHRLGLFPTNKNAKAIVRLMKSPDLDIQGIYTHFATADEEDKAHTHKQVQVFLDFLRYIDMIGGIVPMRHAANSPAITDMPEYYFDMVRPGLILTGYYSSHHMDRARIPVKPAVKLKARLANVKSVPAGDGIGYGYTYQTKRETIVGVIPLGFSDGYFRGLSNKAFVLCKDKLCPIIGNICMDQMMIDVTEVPSPTIGDLVILIGDGTDCAPTAYDIALTQGTIVDEVISRLSSRLPRVYVG